MLLRHLLRFLPGGPFAEGVHAQNRGDHEEARALFRAYLHHAGGRFRERAEFHLCEACIALGDEQAEAGHADAAVAAYSEALELHPEYADVHKKLGDALLCAGRLQEAAAALRRALELNPRFYAARLSLARVHVARGEAGAAVEAIAELQKHCPPLLREKIAHLHDRCRDGDLAAAESALEDLEHAQPDELDVKKAQALEAIQRGDNGLAIAILADLIARRGDYADLHHLLGLAYGNAEMLDDAIIEFRRALELNPNLTKARVHLGVSLLEAGRRVEAGEELRRADDEEPYNPLVLNALKELSILTEA